jgi:hypothetical protein
MLIKHSGTPLFPRQYEFETSLLVLQFTTTLFNLPFQEGRKGAKHDVLHRSFHGERLARIQPCFVMRICSRALLL